MRTVNRLAALSIVALTCACASADTDEPEVADAADVQAGSTWAELVVPQDQLLLESPARIVAPQSRVHVDAPKAGTVTAVLVAVGDRVEVGDPIVSLSMPELLQAAATLGSAERQLATHQERRDALANLAGKGLVGAGDVFELDRDIGALTAQRDNARAVFLISGTTAENRSAIMRKGSVVMRASIDGVVSQLPAIVGAVVPAGSRLATVTGSSPIRVEVVDIRPRPTDVKLEFVGSDGSRFALNPVPVSSIVEPTHGRVESWYEPQDAEPRPDGVRGRVLAYATAEGLLQLPSAALRLASGTAWVVVEREGGAPQMTAVKVLRSSSESALIQSEELAPGDRVAIDPATVLGTEQPTRDDEAAQ